LIQFRMGVIGTAINVHFQYPKIYNTNMADEQMCEVGKILVRAVKEPRKIHNFRIAVICTL
jgi:hypothetical protein